MLAGLVLVLGGVVACGGAGATITRLTVGAPGSDPYTLVSSTDQQSVTPRPQAGGQASGDSPGLYGGTRRTASCDPAKLLQFLQSNPAKARAWAAVHRIGTADISKFIGKLTPVTLRVDTLITNHGYRDAQATSFTAVLQAGVGVLVDEYGTPVVKCNCGNPLTAADKKIKPKKAKYTGQFWPKFSGKKVTVIQPREKVRSFTLVDPGATMAFTRPMGTMGDLDGPPAALPPTETVESGEPGTPGPSDGTPTDGSTPTDGTGDPGSGSPPPPGDGGGDQSTPTPDPSDTGAGDGGGGGPTENAPPPETNGVTSLPADGGTASP